MEEQAIRGVPWTLLTYAGSKALTLAAIVVLAHLLPPGDFGLFSLALLAVGFFYMFRDLGLGATLILRQDRDDARWLGSVLTLSIATGVVIALVTAAVSPLMADLLNEPQLTGLVSALALMTLFGAVGSFYEGMLQRELEFRRRLTGYLAQSILFAAVAIPLAAVGVGVWSLVIGQLAGMAAYSISLWAVNTRRIRPALDRGAVRDAFETGRGFLVQGGVAYVQQNVDYLAVGGIMGSASLGYYSMGYRLAEVPNFAIADPIAKVTFPGFARMRERGEEIGGAFLSTLKIVGLIAFPFGIILSAAADPFTRALFGDNWLPMIGPLMILGLWAAARTIEVTLGWLLNSTGHALVNGGVAAALTVPTVPLLILAAEGGSLTQVAAVVLGHNLAFIAVLAVFVRSRVGVSLRGQLNALRPVLVAAPLTWISTWGVAEATAGLPAALGLAASVLVGAIVFAAVVSAVEPGLLRYAFGQAKRSLGRPSSPATPSEVTAA
ncbi:MAG: lipopolysaccharide biosynthesis protein [Solirubrobacterales bacterium]